MNMLRNGADEIVARKRQFGGFSNEQLDELVSKLRSGGEPTFLNCRRNEPARSE